MKIEIFQGNESIQSTAKTLIIIDVLRAGATAYYLLNSGINRCLLAQDSNIAFEIAKRINCILIGEKQGFKIDGFNFGNSPSEISENNKELENKSIVFVTTNGVTAILNNKHFSEIYFCGFLNAAFTANYIKQKAMEDVAIIASHPTSDDHMACAEYIKSILLDDEKNSKQETINRIMKSESAEKFYNSDYFPLVDLHMCCEEISNPGYVVHTKIDNDYIELIRNIEI